jgi:hypothetical protein
MRTKAQRKKIEGNLSDIEERDVVDERRKNKPRCRNRLIRGFGATIGEMLAAKERKDGESPKTA